MRPQMRQGRGGGGGGRTRPNQARLDPREWRGGYGGRRPKPGARMPVGIPATDGKMPVGGGMPATDGMTPWGAGNAYNAGSTMDQIARNEYLNTLSVGGEREAAMNAMGYWNGGTPFVPQVGQGYNRFHRANAAENQATGAYSSPGIYQHMNADNTGYVGVTNVGADGAAQYTPFASRGRTRRRTGTTGGVLY